MQERENVPKPVKGTVQVRECVGPRPPCGGSSSTASWSSGVRDGERRLLGQDPRTPRTEEPLTHTGRTTGNEMYV